MPPCRVWSSRRHGRRPLPCFVRNIYLNGLFLLFLVNLIGLGLGPLGVGAVSDLIGGTFGLGPAEGVRWSLLIFVLFGAVASALFWLARGSIREEMVS